MEGLKEIITANQLHNKVMELADEINRDYKDLKDIVLVCNLKGAFVFLADLFRKIKIPVSIDFIATSSYNGTEAEGNVRIVKDLKMDIRGKNVMVIEDIVDTGFTLNYVMKYLNLHNPNSIKVCTLLDKRSKRKVEVPIHYTGFIVDDIFLVGYGLDYNEKYRELDYIAELILERD